jgi:uncharacterized integral membrane protein
LSFFFTDYFYRWCYYWILLVAVAGVIIVVAEDIVRVFQIAVQVDVTGRQ